MPRLTADQWAEARALREAGESLSKVAARLGIDRAAVSRRAKREKWGDGIDMEAAIRRKVTEKVTGIVTGCDSKKKAAALDAEAEKRGEVVKRHRDETNAVRSVLYEGLKAHKAATDKLAKSMAFEDLKAAKISSECLLNIHRAERQAWGLDYVVDPKSLEKMSDAELEELAKKGA